MTTALPQLHACQESRDADTPTPLEFAFELLGVNYPDNQASIVALVADDEPRTLFSMGWEAGVDCDLSDTQMPSGDHRQALAWLVGFVAGQYAAANGYPTPFCIYEHHEH